MRIEFFSSSKSLKKTISVLCRKKMLKKALSLYFEIELYNSMGFCSLHLFHNRFKRGQRKFLRLIYPFYFVFVYNIYTDIINYNSNAQLNL